MALKLALIDMDGTLLGKDQIEISPANLQALEQLHSWGVEVVPCTGRVVDMLPPQLLALPWVRYVVSSHGARVYDRHKNVSIYENVISPEDSARILEKIEGEGIYAEIAAEHTIYIEEAARKLLTCPPVPSHHVWYMIDRALYTAVPCLSEYFREKGIGMEKVNIYNMPENMQQKIYDAVTQTGLIRHTRGAAAKDLEFQGTGLCKPKAMEALLRHLHLTYAETFAIGDSSTDADVIRESAVGVAMGNAPEDIQKLADYVTAPNTEDGFAKAVEHFAAQFQAGGKS